jgi:ribosomal protein S6
MVDIMKSWGRRAAAYNITFVLMAKYYSSIFSGQLGVKEGLDQYAAESTKLLQDEIAGKK